MTPLYWVPRNADDADPTKRISLYDRREQIEQRIRRLEGGHAHAQDPRSRLMHVISNVRIHEASGAQVVATSNFVLGELRMDRQVTRLGRNVHTLTRNGES